MMSPRGWREGSTSVRSFDHTLTWVLLPHRQQPILPFNFQRFGRQLDEVKDLDTRWQIPQRIGRKLETSFIGRSNFTPRYLTRTWSLRIILSRDVHMEALLVCHLSSLPNEHTLYLIPYFAAAFSRGKERFSMTELFGQFEWLPRHETSGLLSTYQTKGARAQLKAYYMVERHIWG